MPLPFDAGVSLFTALSHAKSVPKEQGGGPGSTVGLTVRVRVVYGSACGRVVRAQVWSPLPVTFPQLLLPPVRQAGVLALGAAVFPCLEGGFAQQHQQWPYWAPRMQNVPKGLCSWSLD